MTDPQPCPFCGGEPKAEKDALMEVWFIRCRCCPAQMAGPKPNGSGGGFDFEAQAWAAWNTRQ